MRATDRSRNAQNTKRRGFLCGFRSVEQGFFSRFLCDTFYNCFPDFPLHTSGEETMSTRWRRSKKHLKWLDLKTFKFPQNFASKTSHMENFKTARTVHPVTYRLPRRFAMGKYKEPKPLIDMFQDGGYVTIVAQIAGFNQETVKINIKDQKLTLQAKAKDRRYYKSLNLPKVVIPTVAHTTFKNGVLEIKLKKAIKEETIKQQARCNDAT